MSYVLTTVTTDKCQIEKAQESPERFLPLEDTDIPSTPLLNTVMNTVMKVENVVKYQDLARELRKLWKMKTV